MIRTPLFFRLLRSALIFSLLFQSAAIGQADKGVEARGQSGQYDSPRKAFLAAQHEVKPDGHGYQFQNAENQIEATFHDGAVSAKHADASFGLRLAAYGYGNRLVTPAPNASQRYARGIRPWTADGVVRQ